MRTRIAVVLSMVLCACWTAEPIAGGTGGPRFDEFDHRPVVALLPDDLSTSVGAEGQSPGPLLDLSAGVVTQAAVDELLGSVRLVRYPSLEPVAFESRGCFNDDHSNQVSLGLPPSELCTPGKQPQFIELHPVQPLEPGWYALSLISLPKLSITESARNASKVMSDAYVTRFHVGSAPVVQYVTRCPGHDAAESIKVRLSEPVLRPDESVDDIASISAGAAAKCHLFNGGNSFPSVFDEIEFACDLVDENAAWTVTITDGIYASPSVPLQDYGGASRFDVTWQPAAMTSMFDAKCSEWTPTW